VKNITRFGQGGGFNRSILGILIIAAFVVSGFFVSTAFASISLVSLDSPIGGEEWRGVQTITWSGTSDNASDTVDLVLSTDGTNFNQTIATVLFSNGSYSWTIPPLADNSLVRVGIAPTGGAIQDSSSVFTIDNTAPVTTLTIDPIDGLDGWYVTVPAMSLLCADGGSGCDTTFYRWDGGVWVDNSVTPVAASEGSHLFEYYSEDQAVDALGDHNEETIQSLTVKVDTTFPTVAVTSTTADGYYNEPDTVNVTLTFSEPVWSTDTLTVTLDTGGTCSVPILTNATTGTCTYTVGAGENSSDLTVTSIVPASGVVEDIAGNDSTLSPTSNIADTSDIVIDTTAPIAFTTGNVTPSGGTVVTGWWNSTNTGVDVLVPIDNDSTLTGGTVQLQVEADGTYEDVGSAPTILVSWLNTTISLSLTAAELEAIAGFSEGDNLQFRAVITDIAENATTGTQSAASLTVDEIAPSVNAGTDQEVKATVSQDATTSDGGSGLDTHQWAKTVGTGTITFGTPTTVDTTISASAEEIYTITLTVIDVAGNSASDTIQFAWDTTAPVLAEVTPVKNPTNDPTPDYTFSADLVKQLAGSTGEMINYSGSCKATPTTPIDGSNTITLEAAAGGNLADATYADCDLTVTDAAGNTSATLQINDFEVNTIAAMIASVTTEDINEDGLIDKATLVFDDEIDDSTIVLTDFAIEGINPTVMTTGIADDATIVFTFATQIAGTEAKTLDYTSSADDLAGNDIAPFAELSIDEAGPVLLSARTVTTTSIEATFSEDLNGSTVDGGGGEFTASGETVTAAAEHVDDDGRVVLTVDPMDTDATPTVTYNFVAGLSDNDGNEAIDGKFAVAVDGVSPVLTSVSISSDNVKDGTAWAKEGDTVTVAFTGSEELDTDPVVTIGNESATVANVGGNDWTATLVMDGDDPEGIITFTINFEDVATPTHNVGTQVTAVTDATSILYDRTNPTVNAGVDREVNAVVSPQGATASDAGSDVDTYAWTDVGPGTITYSNQSGTGTAVDTDISADTDGTYTITLTIEDEAGNIATDEITFIWDTTNPVQEALTAPDPQTDVLITAGTAKVRFDEDIVLLDASRVLLKDNSGTSYKGTVAVDGGDGASAILNIDYTGLAYGTTYDVIVKPNSVSDVAGNNVSTNFTAQFTTEIDTVVPVVNSLSASSITTTGATLNVTTNENATCSYATTDSEYASMTAFDAPNTGTSHTAVLTGLTASTGHDYFVRCADTTTQTNTMTTSAHVSFTTLTPDTTGPVISDIQATSIGETSATITWNTDENATSRVEYGPTSLYGSFTAVDATADNTTHSVALVGLSDGTDYHFRVISADAVPNSSTSGDNVFTTVTAIDTMAPDVPAITTSATIIDADTYTVAGTVANDGGTRIVSLFNGATLAGTASVPAGDTVWSILATLTQDAGNVFTATADDEAGNTSVASASVTITEATATGDTDAPAVPVISGSDEGVDADTYTLSGTAGADTPADGPRTITVYRNGVVVGSVVLPVGETDWSLVVPLLQDATNTFTAYSTDQSNNISAVSNSRVITEATVPDTTAPVIVLLGENPLTFTEGDDYEEHGATASDDVDGDISGDIDIDDSDVDMDVAGTYTVTYDVEDAAGNSATQVTRTVIVEAAFDDTAELAVTGIDAVDTFATADNTYENGWSWVFHITVPTDETEFAMKFADFVSGGDTIAAADNIRFYSAQSSDSFDTSTATAITAANTYSTAITLDTDLESGTSGRQIDVTVEMKVPTGSAGGSYSAQYGVKSEVDSE